MNWLAHLYLSDPHIESRLGNLLADVVRGEERARMSEAFRLGARRHLEIDSFTDRHPVVKRSRSRIPAPYRRFSGVLVDVFYDHFLARDWPRHAGGTLEAFNEAVREECLARPLELTPTARLIVERMIVERRFLGYATTAGIGRALERMSARIERRFGRDPALGRAAEVLDERLGDFGADFEEFFPQLRASLGLPLAA